MEKLYHHRKIIKVPIYNDKVAIVFSNDKDTVQKYIKPDLGELYAYTVFGNLGEHKCTFLILNFDYDFCKITHGVIAHECLHVVSEILSSSGVKFDPDNEEPFTYLLEYITNEVYKYMSKKGFKVNYKR